jgi:hypothetical protein
MSDYSDLVTLAEFGEEIEVTAQTVKGWMDKYAKDFTGDMADFKPVIPVKTFGNTNVYSRQELLHFAAQRGNTQAIKTAGYVHPDKFKESEDARIRLAGENAMMETELSWLRTEYSRAAEELGWTHNYHQYASE